MKMSHALLFASILALGGIVVSPSEAIAQSGEICSVKTCPPPSACEVDRDYCTCIQVYDPVCGMDGHTYGNSCLAACSCMEIAYEGECNRKCTMYCAGTDYEPVCGHDGETYGNECYAECWGAKPVHKGSCSPYVVLPPKPPVLR